LHRLWHQPEANPKKSEIIDGVTIKYHANGETIWSKGKIIDDKADGYWSGIALTKR
jgi:hypothetical protein